MLSGSSSFLSAHHPHIYFLSLTPNSSLSMKLEGAAADLVGSDIEYPEFDPWGFSKTADEETMAWYRAAELKHGR